MNISKENIIFLGIGAVAGFVVGYKLLEKKVKADYKEKLDRVTAQVSAPANKDEKDDDSDAVAISPKQKDDYESLVSDLMYKASEEADEAEKAHDDISPETENKAAIEDQDADYEDDEVTIKRNVPTKKHKKPKMLKGGRDYDPDDPVGNEYEEVPLYFFVKSDQLTDENGNALNETDTIGVDLRRIGFMREDYEGPQSQWIRNYDEEKNFLVRRENFKISDWFDEEVNARIYEEDEEQEDEE